MRKGFLARLVRAIQLLFAGTRRENPGLKIEQTKSTKADLVAALKDAVAYCDKAYDGITGASGSQTVKLFDMGMPKFGC